MCFLLFFIQPQLIFSKTNNEDKLEIDHWSNCQIFNSLSTNCTEISKIISSSKSVLPENIKPKTVIVAKIEENCGDNVRFIFVAGTITISGEGPMDDYTTTVPPPWNEFKTDIRTVIVEEGVTHIGDRAFFSCTSLTSINMQNTVQSIGTFALYGAKFASITFPDSLVSIGEKVFYAMSTLAEVNFGNGLKYILQFAFYQTGIKSITLPNTLQEIRTKAFYLCESLTSLTLPSSLSSVEDSAFYQCSNLKSVTFEGISDIQHGKDVFTKCVVLASVNVPYDYTGNTFCGISIIRSTAKFTLSSLFSASVSFSRSESFSTSDPFSTSDSFSTSDPFRASASFSRSESFSSSDHFSTSASFSRSESFSASDSFSTSESFSDSIYISSPDDASSPQDDESPNIAVIIGVVVSIIACALVVAAVLIIYIKKLACFRPKEDQFNSEIEATADICSITDNTVPDHLDDCNSDVLNDPFAQIME